MLRKVKEYLGDYLSSHFENKYINSLVNYAIDYYKDFIFPNKKYKIISNKEEEIFVDLKKTLENMNEKLEPQEIQTQIYEIGKRHNFNNLRDFFKLIYQVLLGQDQGPRLGSFIALYGINRSIRLIEKAINKEDLSEQML